MRPARRTACACCLLLALTLPARGLDLRQQAQRGLEDHKALFVLGHTLAGPRDSLSLDLRAEWRAGFRDYNRDSRRLYEQARLDGTRRLPGPWRLRWGAGQSVFNERRSLRETLGSSLDLGLRRAGPLDVEVLGGWRQDRRQTGYDSGPRLRLGLTTRGVESDWQWGARGSWLAEQPGARRNVLALAALDAAWKGPESSRDDLSLSVKDQREDAFPDPLREDLERRRGLDLALENRFQGRLGRRGHLRADLSGWLRDQDRRPRGSSDSLGGTRGSALDRGLELRTDQRLRLGTVETWLGLTLRRQLQDARYGALAHLSRTLSTIALNRLEGGLLWRPQDDSLSARAAVELRRCDTDFEGPVRRDPDYMDQARREGRLRWSRSWPEGARLSLEGGVVLQAERHLQASRSRSNYLSRTWRTAAGHRLGLGGWGLAGGGALVADYRLYDFDDPGQPRSWIQRRLQWEERARRPLEGLLPSTWALAGELRGRWMEEDGGSFVRREGLERISDSAREWQLESGLEARRGPWTLRPGWSWLERRDWRWSSPAGRLQRDLVRELRRQGPLWALSRASRRGALRLDLQWEWTRDQGRAEAVKRRSLRGRLEWSLRLP